MVPPSVFEIEVKLVEQAILKSALVIMITGAGGSLGYVIRETGIQNEIVIIL